MNSITQIVKNNLELSQNVPLKIALYHAFKKTIVLREIPAGTRINEKEFSSELNISRTPIRYALGVLEEEKLVEHIPNRGIIVKGVSLQDALEIFEIRKALETLASTTAMNLMTKDDFEEMRQLLETCECYLKNQEIDKVLANFNDFNNLIYEKSQMLRLKEIVSELQAYLLYFRRISISSDDRRRKALDEHWLIYRGMKNKDYQQVTLITHEHLNHSLEFIIQEMEETNDQ
ncbi:GntR family transcriptional regulator [Streptococcus uberis]|uniref:GntR family transcriptional regulator n=1 Tax=Streptococcus uberis TaxID=1349 RepID=UPI000541C860|nr:GntR family transcriptional regulator [Streptococcus uberis]KHD40490.1 GntR family transcriptional regulator [Streptococcus hongkongensis]KKF46010.1 GntR family transcriptional regulator [Streptococcus uberis C5072]KKF52020.1 GntR family transcriptional regulator [Streptococcus uberis B190]KKF55232.1 GntR family transcriptional regulator [Streptococcus uberis 6780]KKF59308.1 GntR family transcriptional regulator [Streptococcus uberis C6344]